jgi:hypothetical protein
MRTKYDTTEKLLNEHLGKIQAHIFKSQYQIVKETAVKVVVTAIPTTQDPTGADDHGVQDDEYSELRTDRSE